MKPAEARGEKLLRALIREFVLLPSAQADELRVGMQHFASGPSIRRAACVLLRRGGRVLAVSRKDDPTAMGLPGGKVDPEDGHEGAPEALACAAARELQEETGLRVAPELLRWTFERAEDDGFTTTTFEADWADVHGPIRTAEQGRVRWVTWEELLDGPFGEYNKQLLATIDPSR